MLCGRLPLKRPVRFPPLIKKLNIKRGIYQWDIMELIVYLHHLQNTPVRRGPANRESVNRINAGFLCIKKLPADKILLLIGGS